MARHIAVGKPINSAEQWAFEFLKDNLGDKYTLITNVDVYDDRGQPFEVDAIVVGEWAVYLLDIKGYRGGLRASKDIWEHEGRYVDNPLPKLNHNARALASRCRRRLKANQHAPWCQSAVFITGGEGGAVNIDCNDYDLPVFGKDKIIESLTQTNYLTCQYKRQLRPYQKEIALESLCDFHLLQKRDEIVGGYKKLEKLLVNGKLETWLVEPLGHTFQYNYWLKCVDLTACDHSEAESFRASFKKEYYLLTELSDIPSVPLVLAYIDDGELLGLVHECINGTPLDKADLSIDELLHVFLSVAKTIEAIQVKGVHHRALCASNIYVLEGGHIQLLDVGYAKADQIATLVTPEQLANPWFAPEYIANNHSTNASEVFTLAAIFVPYFSKEPPLSNNSMEFVEEAYKYLPSEKCEKVNGLGSWFRAALSLAPSDRPTITEAIICLTAYLKTGRNEPSQELGEGAVIGSKYELLYQIGMGSASAVWKAKHLIGEYDCCLKILEEFEGADEIAKKEFEVLRTSYHPNVIRVFDLDRLPNTDRYYLSCQYIDGPTLWDIDLAKEDIWKYFSQLLGALQYLHRININHKDVKPENIIIEKGNAYLIDFNISSLDSRLLGTVRYKDPLVIEQGWTPFADIYSLVVTFVELYLGRHPFCSCDDIPNMDIVVSLPSKIVGISSATRSRILQALNHQVDWNEISDYLAWFGLKDQVDITIPEEIKKSWAIRDGYMIKVLECMLADMHARSRQVVIRNTLKANSIVGNKTNRGSVNATISALKRMNIIEEHGKKIRLTTDFRACWNNYIN